MSCASTKTEERNAQNEYTGFQHLGLTLRGSHSPPRRLRLESLECKQAPAERQLRPGWTVRGGAGGGQALHGQLAVILLQGDLGARTLGHHGVSLHTH